MKLQESATKYKVLLILGISLIPVGIATHVIALTAVGGLFFIAAVANRGLWLEK